MSPPVITVRCSQTTKPNNTKLDIESDICVSNMLTKFEFNQTLFLCQIARLPKLVSTEIVVVWIDKIALKSDAPLTRISN